MPEWVEEWPFAALWVFFWCGAMLRGSALHLLGRVGRTTASRARHRGGDAVPATPPPAARPAVVRAQRVVERWGAPVVALSFLTVGTQSAVLVASGVLRMPPARFVPALVVGAIAWATVYTTVGMAVVWALVGGASQRVGWWLVAAAVLAVVVAVATRRLRTADPRG